MYKSPADAGGNNAGASYLHYGPVRAGQGNGHSIEMIERHYGTLLDGATAGIADRLGAFQANQDLQDNTTTMEDQQ
jgi:hypothetical protein